MQLQFTKMHGLGNDIVIVNALTEVAPLSPRLLQTLANRHTGIGYDQLILIKPSRKADFFCEIYNSDGSRAQQCGNGMRCVARYLHEKGLHSASTLTLETLAGIVHVNIHSYEYIEVIMGIPIVHQQEIPVIMDSIIAPPILVSMGNPHLILRVASIIDSSIEKTAQSIASDPLFSDGINIGFMQIVNSNTIYLQTFERGAGKTLACGSNACAAVAAGISQNVLNSHVSVELELGKLAIAWSGPTQAIHISGPATHVYEGVMRQHLQ